MSKVIVTLPYPKSSSLTRYLEAVYGAPMLSAEEEFALARRLLDHHDRKAAETLVLSHLRLVVRVARGYLGYGLEFADLIQEGTFGLMRAVKRFDPERGVRLSAFAVHFIRAHIHEFVLRNWRIVRMATTKAQRKLFFNLRRHKKRLERLGREDAENIAEMLDVSTEEVESMDARLYGNDATIGLFDVGDSPGDGALVVKALTDPGSDPLADCEACEQSARRVKALERGLQALDSRSRDIIKRRWLKADKETLAELGDEYGITKERVRQIEEKALARLRLVLETEEAA